MQNWDEAFTRAAWRRQKRTPCEIAYLVPFVALRVEGGSERSHRFIIDRRGSVLKKQNERISKKTMDGILEGEFV